MNSHMLVISRLAANVFDNILLALLTLFIVLIITFTSFDVLHIGNFMDMMKVEPLSLDGSIDQPYKLVQSMVFFLVNLSLLYTFISFVYFQTLLSSKKRATFGMQLLKLELVSVKDTELTFISILLRTIYFLVLKAFYIGVISLVTMVLTEKKQALHDMATSSTIVKKN